MTRLVTIGKRGPAFREPRSLADTLKASVDFLAEAKRQRETAERTQEQREAGPLPSDEALRTVHEDLNLLIGLSRWVPR